MTHYTFKLTYGKGKSAPTTKVRVLDRETLLNLADVLLDSVGFELDHAFGFHSSLKSPYDRNMEREFTAFADHGDANIDSDTGVENTDVSDVFKKGDKMLFHFDYGDDWCFLVQCISIEKTPSRKRNPEILEVIGEFPEQYPDYHEDENGEIVDPS